MKINLNRFEETLGHEARLHKALGLPTTVRSEIALDTVHALNDITRSLADLHPHKRSIATLGALPEPLSRVATNFASQGYNVQEIPVSFLLDDEQATQSFWNTLKKDTLFILCAQVEPFTGVLYPLDFVRREAAKKSIFTVIYQSPDASRKELLVPANAFEGVIVDPLWGEENPLALVLKGERCQGEKLLWGDSHYGIKALETLLQSLTNKNLLIEDRKKILDFENQFKMHMGHSIHFLGDKIHRLFDRAVIFAEGVDGEALSSELKKQSITSYTASACAWLSPHLNGWLPRLAIPAAWAQCSLILPLDELGENTFTAVVAVIQSLRKISGYQS